jgi:hypothetical protein
VLLLGGYSMTFSYGLRDLGAAARNGDALTIRLCSPPWPGFDTYRMFHVYKDPLSRSRAAYRRDFVLEESWRISQTCHATSTSSRTALRRPIYSANSASSPRGARNATGQWYYKSMLAHKLGNELNWLDGRMTRALRRLGVSTSSEQAPVASSATDEERGAERFRAWTDYLTEYFGGSDRVLFVFLPRKAQTFTGDRYDV